MVSYGGKVIHDPYKSVIRVSNGGSIPIEQRDVEAPISFRIDKAVLLDVAVVRRSPANLKANEAWNVDRIVVEHGLMNPADYFEIEVLTDGNPGWPVPTFRIAGVPEARVTVLSDERQLVRPTFFTFGRSVEWTILLVAAFVPVLLLVPTVWLVWSTLKRIWPAIACWRVRRGPLDDPPPGADLPSVALRQLTDCLPSGVAGDLLGSRMRRPGTFDPES